MQTVHVPFLICATLCISITYFDKVLSNEDTHVDVARVNLVLVNELNLRVSRLT